MLVENSSQNRAVAKVKNGPLLFTQVTEPNSGFMECFGVNLALSCHLKLLD